MLIAIAQLRPDRNDPDANEQGILAAIDGARRAGATLLVTSGAALTGLFDDGAPPPAGVAARIDRIAAAAGPLTAAIGLRTGVWTPARRKSDGSEDSAVAVVGGGRARPELLPLRSAEARVVEIAGRRVAIVDGAGLRADAPITPVAGVQAIAAVDAAPFAPEHDRRWARALQHCAEAWGAVLAWANAVGAAPGRVFDGGSLVMGPTGERLQQLPTWHPTLALARIGEHARPVRGDVERADGRDSYFGLCEAIGAGVRESGRAGAGVEPPADAAGALALMAAIDVLGPGRVRQSLEAAPTDLRVRVRFADQAAEPFALAIPQPGRLEATIARPFGLAAARWRHALGRLVPDSLLPPADS